jgi:hypothetical protein
MTVISYRAPAGSWDCCFSRVRLAFIQEDSMREELRHGVRTDATDSHPGALPEISSDGGSISYVVAVVAQRRRRELIIRCDIAGEVWLSIRPADGIRTA